METGKQSSARRDWTGQVFKLVLTLLLYVALLKPRGREVLGFTHHREVAVRDDADELLDWAEETIATTGKPRSTRELRAEGSRRSVTVGRVRFQRGSCPQRLDRLVLAIR